MMHGETSTISVAVACTYTQWHTHTSWSCMHDETAGRIVFSRTLASCLTSVRATAPVLAYARARATARELYSSCSALVQPSLYMVEGCIPCGVSCWVLLPPNTSLFSLGGDGEHPVALHFAGHEHFPVLIGDCCPLVCVCWSLRPPRRSRTCYSSGTCCGLSFDNRRFWNCGCRPALCSGG